MAILTKPKLNGAELAQAMAAKAIYDALVAHVPALTDKAIEKNLGARLETFEETLDTRAQDHHRQSKNELESMVREMVEAEITRLSRAYENTTRLFLERLEGLIKSLPGVTVNLPELAPVLKNVVNVPEQRQPAPVVNNVVQVPEQKTPTVTVNVPEQKPMKRIIKRDNQGNMTEVEETPV